MHFLCPSSFSPRLHEGRQATQLFKVRSQDLATHVGAEVEDEASVRLEGLWHIRQKAKALRIEAIECSIHVRSASEGSGEAHKAAAATPEAYVHLRMR